MSDFNEDDLYHEDLPNICTAVKEKTVKCCSVNTVRNVVPVLKWMPHYKWKFLLNDVVAGLTVGLTAIPQAIAYAIVAGLPPQYGLYSAFMGCFAYIFFGTCKDITVGPTAIMSLMVQSYTVYGIDYAVLMCFTSGCIIILMGVLNLGVLMQFVSVPVITGFTMSAAITIASGQVNNLFGMKSPSNDFLVSWEHFFGHITETRRNDAILGVCTLVCLLLLRKVKDLPCRYKQLTKYISLARNVMAVVVGILLCYLLSDGDYLPFRVSGEITPGIPPFRLPPFGTEKDGESVSFGQMLNTLGAGIIGIPLIAVLESVAIAKAFSKGKIVDASQEMIALGVANLATSFFSGYPITGSFARSAINNASGVKTPLGGAITGTVVLMALAFLTSTFYYIPKATLSAIIIGAVIFMIEFDRIAEIWRSKKTDLLPFTITVLCCLFWSLEYGIVTGIASNLIFILYRGARPTINITAEKVNANEVLLVELKGSLSYSSGEYVKAKIVKSVTSQTTPPHWVVIDGSKIESIDSTIAFNIISLKEDLALQKCELVLWNWKTRTAGVICRIHRKDSSMLKFGTSLDKIIEEPATVMTTVLEM